MSMSHIDEAKTWVAKHQELNPKTHEYTCRDPFEPNVVHSCKSTGELVLRVSVSFQKESPKIWRRRFGIRDF